MFIQIDVLDSSGICVC